MNLINDAWIPVRRKNGKIERVAPWQITEGTGGEAIIELAAPRPDFNGSLIQFLIGLVQITFAPENPRQWRQQFNSPPKPEGLKKAFMPFAHVFNLKGDGPLFMQEPQLRSSPKTNLHELTYLLIDAPTDNTIKNNIDLFVKRNALGTSGDVRFCLPCAATALYTMQTFAPSGGGGGGGKFTSLRGGGPFNTVIKGDTIWQTVWLNVVEKSYCASHKKYPLEYTFPWLLPENFVKDKTKKSVSSAEMAPLHIYWGMPRRIFLIVEEETDKVLCSLCGDRTLQYVRNYRDKTMGMSYFIGEVKSKKASWVTPLHPLTPYWKDEQGRPSAFHARPGCITYRYWIGLVLAASDEKISPAITVIEFMRRHLPEGPRLWAYGYEMDKMNARCWYDSLMPLILADDNIRNSYEYHTAALVQSADQVSRETRRQVKRALFKPENEVKGDLSFIELRFWQETEADFFNSLRQLRDALTVGRDIVPILEDWHKRLVREAEVIFNDISQTGSFDAADPKRIALAWLDLRKGIYSKKLREQLGLPVKTGAS